MAATTFPLLEITNLKTHFFLDEGTVRAVDGVTFSVPHRRTLGVVGESGCGKSITAHSILRIVRRPGRIVQGEIWLNRVDGHGDGHGAGAAGQRVDLTKLAEDGREMLRIRGSEIAMIFQEPMSSLSPVHTIGAQIMEAILLHQRVGPRAARQQAVDMLRKVGIPSPERRVDEYPHQLSGGLRQRAMIAMALSCNPKLLIADEPTTALDVTIQAQILDLLRGLQQEFGMAIMLITHNLGVVAEMADEVVVMYMGRVVEQAGVKALFRTPQHPYTQSLLKSIPKVGQHLDRLESIRGSVPDPFSLPKGCPFHPRCDHAIPGRCDVGAPPPLVQTADDHRVACVLYGDARRDA
jgi:peptide/nickel transport system ATP-binding protein